MLYLVSNERVFDADFDFVNFSVILKCNKKLFRNFIFLYFVSLGF